MSDSYKCRCSTYCRSTHRALPSQKLRLCKATFSPVIRWQLSQKMSRRGDSQWRSPLCHVLQLSSVAQSCLTLCDPMDCSTPGLPVHHQLPELAQTHVHQVSDAIQSSHPLSSPSPPAFNLSQHQRLFKWVSSHQVLDQRIGDSASTSVLPMNIQDWSPLGWTDWISLQSKGLSRVFSNTTVQKNQFFGAQLSL